jgi:histone H3/H4
MADKETLVVTSKVKNYIRTTSGLNCSGKVIDALSDKVRELCDAAIANARNSKRKTVQDKDVL